MAEKAKKGDIDELEVLKSISEGIANLGEEVRALKGRMESVSERVGSLEKGGRDDFMKEARPEDVEAAAARRKGIDPRIVKIVDETLGTDFGVELRPLPGDRIGYEFTLLVPERMNDSAVEKRPVKDPVSGEPKKDALGTVIMEDYRRPDRRSRIIASTDSYSTIREHCEKVRAYITAFYATQRKPMPALHVK